MSDKPKFPRAVALDVCRQILAHVRPGCERVIVAGSLRRNKKEVGDIEILYIPIMDQEREGLFDLKLVSRVDKALDWMLRAGVIAKRKNVNGSEMWGEKNKLALHVATGIPVDFFCTTAAAWFNYLVCRTGSAENNTRIAMAAKERGLRWNPYGEGFTWLSTGDTIPVKEEKDVFRIAGLPYKEPHQR